MFDNVIAILRVAAPQAAADILFGELPNEVTPEILTSLQGDKPQLRKNDGKLIVCFPIRLVDESPSVWAIWVLAAIPPVTELQSTIEKLRAASAQFEVARGASTDARVETRDLPAYLAGESAARAGRIRAKAMRSILANALSQSGLAEKTVVFDVKPTFAHGARAPRRRIKAPEFSDQSLIMLTDELKAMVAKTQSDEIVFKLFEAQDFSDVGLDAGLLADLALVRNIAVLTPSLKQGGLAIIAFDPQDDIEVHLRAMQNSFDLSQRTRSRLEKPWLTWIKRMAVFAVGGAVLFYALMPAPMRVSTTVVSEPSQAIAETLPNEAFLSELNVAVGDTVEKGQVIARFIAPSLEERRNDILLQLKVEELTAQTALSEQDYAAFVLSEQNKDAQQERLNQVNSRLAALDIRASTRGRVISTMPPNVVGSYTQLGADVAIIQPQDVFDIKMQIADIDAPLIERGQTGEVYFRGIADQTYPVKVTSDVTVIPNPALPEDDLIVWGRITTTEVERLTTGLSGFAKISVVTRPRIFAWSRYVSEWIKEKSWIYLDLRF